MSDTHGFHQHISVPEGDILVHAGDFTGRGGMPGLIEFLQWFSAQPHPYKVLIAGNHDFLFEKKNGFARELLGVHAPSVVYLQDSGALIAGYNFWGSPVQPRYFDFAFNRDRGPDIRSHWDQIPLDTEVLITHGPPEGILDVLADGGGDGCADLLATIHRLPKLRLHIFGHLHADGGSSERRGRITFVNAAMCNDANELMGTPIIVTLVEGGG